MKEQQPSIQTEVSSKSTTGHVTGGNVHFVLLLHGLYGSSANLWCLEEEIAVAHEKSDDGLQLHVLNAGGYAGAHTWDGIDVNAWRVANEVRLGLDTVSLVCSPTDDPLAREGDRTSRTGREEGDSLEHCKSSSSHALSHLPCHCGGDGAAAWMSQPAFLWSTFLPLSGCLTRCNACER